MIEIIDKIVNLCTFISAYVHSSALYARASLFFHSTSPLMLFIYLIIVLILFRILRMILTLITTKFLTHRKVILTRPYPNGKKILIVGDSTGVGTGAKKGEDTIAGLFARDFPHSNILNLAVNGSLTRDVLDQLKAAGNTVFDLIVISTGGNDIWNYTGLKSLSRDLVKVLETAKVMSNCKVIVLFFGNEGSAPFFPIFIRGFLLRRTEKVKDVFLTVTQAEKVPCIELFTSYEDNPFVKDPKRFFARDKLHPSSDGYAVWYERMWRLMVEKGYLYDENMANHTSRFSDDLYTVVEGLSKFRNYNKNPLKPFAKDPRGFEDKTNSS